jgi:hypothetical protein
VLQGEIKCVLVNHYNGFAMYSWLGSNQASHMGGRGEVGLLWRATRALSDAIATWCVSDDALTALKLKLLIKAALSRREGAQLVPTKHDVTSCRSE